MADRVQLVCLFMHHADDGITNRHWEMLRRHDRDGTMRSVAIHLPGSDHVAESVEVSKDAPWPIAQDGRTVRDDLDLVHHNWWAGEDRVEAEHYALLEWDCRVDVDPIAFYAGFTEDYYDLVAATVRRPIDRWPHFEGANVDALPDRARPHWLGVAPLAGTLVSRRLMHAIHHHCDPLEWSGVWCEMRLATMASWLGAEVDRGNDWRCLRFGAVEPNGPGIWHAVKK